MVFLAFLSLLVSDGSSRIPPYAADGMGRRLALYDGTYVGSERHEPHVRWEIDVIQDRVFGTYVATGSERYCMIAKPQDNGLLFVWGTREEYSSEYGGRAFGVDNVPVLSLEPGGIRSKTEFEGFIPTEIVHFKRISAKPNVADMYELAAGGAHVSCVPR